MRDKLMKKGTEDFWLAGVENDSHGKGYRFNFIASDGKRTE
jgi:hypothetical protein